MFKQELKEKIVNFVDELCKENKLEYGRITIEIADSKCVMIEITDKHKRESSKNKQTTSK